MDHTRVQIAQNMLAIEDGEQSINDQQVYWQGRCGCAKETNVSMD